MDKVDKALERLKIGSDMSLKYYDKPLMITYSGGKDSEVLVHLAIKSKIPLEIVNSHTTVSDGGRIQGVFDMGVLEYVYMTEPRKEQE